MNLIKWGAVIPSGSIFSEVALTAGLFFHVRNDADGGCASPKANACNTLFSPLFYQGQRLLTTTPLPEGRGCFETLRNKK